MDLRQIRTFTVIADEGSVTEAADRLHLTQPALSRHIRELERELGISLLVRAGRGIRLSPEGSSLLPKCKEILKLSEALKREASALTKNPTSIFRVGATPQLIEGIFSDALGRFRDRHGGIRVEITEAGGADLFKKLNLGEIDIAVSATSHARGLEVRPISDCPILAVMKRGHPLKLPNSVQVSLLANEPVMLLAEGFISREIFLSECRLLQLSPDIRFESSSPQTLLALAEAGEGIAILPATVRLGARKLDVAPLFNAGKRLEFELSAIFSPKRPAPLWSEDLIDDLRRVARKAI